MLKDIGRVNEKKIFSAEMMWKHVLPCVRLATRLPMTKSPNHPPYKDR